MGVAKYYKFKKDITESGMHRAEFKQVPRNYEFDIDDYMFSGNTNVTRIIVQERTTLLCQSSFLDCPNLKEVILPPSVNEIESPYYSERAYGPFHGCNNLEKIIFFEYPKNLINNTLFSILADEYIFDENQQDVTSIILLAKGCVYLPDQYANSLDAEFKERIAQAESQGITAVNKKDAYFKPISEFY